MAEAQRIKSDEQALEAARQFAEQIRTGSAARDKERRLPFEEIEWFSQTGLWGITVPKEYGGGGGATGHLHAVRWRPFRVGRRGGCTTPEDLFTSRKDRPRLGSNK